MARVPLPTLLSWVLLAHTIEFDNEFERATASADSPAFKVSMVMWSNFLRFVPRDGISVDELTDLSLAPSSQVRSTLGGLERWGYVLIDGEARRDGWGSGRGIRGGSIVRPTKVAQRAQVTWQPLFDTIEDRWEARFGKNDVDRLRNALRTVVERLAGPLPQSPPIVDPTKGFFTEVRCPERKADAAGLPLAALLAQPLVAFTIDFEREAEVALPLCANVLRVMGGDGVPLRDLPRLGGVSKEAVAMAAGYLGRNGFVTVAPDPAVSRTKVARLTPTGHAARKEYIRRAPAVEDQWGATLGEERIQELRVALERITRQRQPLSEGLVPPETGWRARKPYLSQTQAVIAEPTQALPHHPMVLHRGGWPDGS